jgi:hypothetical protein
VEVERLRIVIKLDPKLYLETIEEIKKEGIIITTSQKFPYLVLGKITKHTSLQKLRDLPGVKYVETCLYKNED